MGASEVNQQTAAETDRSMIRVETLVAKYGDVQVLHGVSLDVKEGEIMVVMGQSGCGKTTLLRHLMGLNRPHAGRVVIEGEDVGQMDEEAYIEFCRSLGVLFQSGALFNSLSVGDNIAFPLREHTDLAEPVIRIMTEMKLRQVGLEGTEDLMPAELSGGMRKRAGLARALALDPSLLLLDEPTTGLDPITASGIDDLILKLREAYKATMVVVCHDIACGLRVADRIELVLDGRIVAMGTQEEIGASDNPYVKEFFERGGETCELPRP